MMRYRCPCGIDLDRDVNAACNIRLRGLEQVADSGGWPEVLGKTRAGTAGKSTKQYLARDIIP